MSFSDTEEYQSFSYPYCHLCSNKKVLKKSYWEAYPEKLPEDVSLSNLIDNQDLLTQSWNQIKALGCFLPNDPAHTPHINTKKILQPEKHWCSVHNEKKGKRNSVLQKQLTYVPLSLCIQKNFQRSQVHQMQLLILPTQRHLMLLRLLNK